MRLTKKQRMELHARFAGLSAYCGYELAERRHTDHFEPVVRQANERVPERPANYAIGNISPPLSQTLAVPRRRFRAHDPTTKIDEVLHEAP